MKLLSFELLAAATRRLFAARFSPGLILLLLGPAFGFSLLIHAFPNDVSLVSEELVDAVSVAAVFSLAALMVWAFWKWERAAADYQDKSGDFFAWFGWGLLAYSPLILV